MNVKYQYCKPLGMVLVNGKAAYSTASSSDVLSAVKGLTDGTRSFFTPTQRELDYFHGIEVQEYADKGITQD